MMQKIILVHSVLIAMASSTVPEYFNKYNTGAKFHVVQFQMCCSLQQLPVSHNNFRNLHLKEHHLQQGFSSCNYFAKALCTSQLHVSISGPTWLFSSNGFPMRNCLYAATSLTLS
jgi:hypothetical protein